MRVGTHEAGELIAGHDAEPRAFVGDSRERIGLVADEPGQAEQRTSVRLDGHQLLASRRCHGDGGLAAVEDVEALWVVALFEENTIHVTGDGGGMLLERLDQLGVGDECRRV